jgi:hypothetical protein
MRLLTGMLFSLPQNGGRTARPRAVAPALGRDGATRGIGAPQAIEPGGYLQAPVSFASVFDPVLSVPAELSP